MATEQEATALKLTKDQLRQHAFDGINQVSAMLHEDRIPGDLTPAEGFKLTLAIAQVQATCAVAFAVLSLGAPDA